MTIGGTTHRDASAIMHPWGTIERRGPRQHEKPCEFIVILCMAQSAASGKKEGETRDLLPFKERGRETWTTTVVVEEA